MISQPQLLGDHEKLVWLAAEERAKKIALAEAAGCYDGTNKKPFLALTSNARCAAKFRELGVEPPMKLTANGVAPALSKKDAFMMECLRRDDAVGRLARARVAVKTTIEEKRADTLATRSSSGAATFGRA